MSSAAQELAQLPPGLNTSWATIRDAFIAQIDMEVDENSVQDQLRDVKHIPERNTINEVTKKIEKFHAHS
jgi:hypothetical protein